MNGTRIQTGDGTPLNHNDVICFGCDVVNNELRYRFLWSGNEAMLERIVEGPLLPRCAPTSLRSTPPRANTPRRAVNVQCSSATQSLKIGSDDVIGTSAPPAASTPSPAHISVTSLAHSSSLNPMASHPALCSLPALCSRPALYSHPALCSHPTLCPSSSHLQSVVSSQAQSLPHVTMMVPIVGPSFSSTVTYSQPTPTQVYAPCSSPGAIYSVADPAGRTPVSPTMSAHEGMDDLFQYIVSNSDSNLLDGVSVVETAPFDIPKTPPEAPSISAEMDIDNVFEDIVFNSDGKLLDGESATESPSPAASTSALLTGPTNQAVEDQFDHIVNTSGIELLGTAVESVYTETELTMDETMEFCSKDEILGGDGPIAETPPVLLEDTTTIEDQSQQEKDELLSSIAALKSDLAAKNELASGKHAGSDMTSKDVDSVVSSMTEEFKCVICQELFISAHTLPCSHSFCEFCIKQWMKTKKVCPICRRSNTLCPVHTLALDNAIAAVESKLSAEEKRERDALKEQHRIQLEEMASDEPAAEVSSASPLDGALALVALALTLGAPDSDEEFDEELDHLYDYDPPEYGDLDVFAYNSGYGGFGRCYHCGKLSACVCYICKERGFRSTLGVGVAGSMNRAAVYFVYEWLSQSVTSSFLENRCLGIL